MLAGVLRRGHVGELKARLVLNADRVARPRTASDVALHLHCNSRAHGWPVRLAAHM